MEHTLDRGGTPWRLAMVALLDTLATLLFVSLVVLCVVGLSI